MNLFANTAQTTNEVTDPTTTTSSFAVPETNLYAATLEIAYLNPSAPAGRVDIIFQFKLENGFVWKYPVYSVLKNGRTHDGTNKDGTPKLNYGFQTATRIAATFCGKTLEELGGNVVSKIIEVYDYNTSRNVPTTVQAFGDCIGAKGFVALTRKVVNKKVKVGDSYVDLPERKQEAVLTHPVSLQGKTFSELRAGTQPEIAMKWVSSNKGKDWDDYKPVATTGAVAQPTTPTAAPTTAGAFNFG